MIHIETRRFVARYTDFVDSVLLCPLLIRGMCFFVMFSVWMLSPFIFLGPSLPPTCWFVAELRLCFECHYFVMLFCSMSMWKVSFECSMTSLSLFIHLSNLHLPPHTVTVYDHNSLNIKYYEKVFWMNVVAMFPLHHVPVFIDLLNGLRAS